MAISSGENGENKIIFTESVHFKYVIVNTIKCNLVFDLDILNTEIFNAHFWLWILFCI